jgi:pyridoxamine 5'-phosphate oxidase
MRVRPPRTEYRLARLTEATAPADPYRLFGRWFRAVLARTGPDPHALVLATVDRRGRPSARVMLLKEWSAAGFVFATNYASRKGSEIASNPRAALLFYWPDQQRQVRAEGRVAPLASGESDAIWASRPRGAQVGAWSSPQSRRIAGREALDRRMARTLARFGDRPIPRPPHWGGYRLLPGRIEFWQGRANRMHDRILYTRRRAGWTRSRLAP